MKNENKIITVPLSEDETNILKKVSWIVSKINKYRHFSWVFLLSYLMDGEFDFFSFSISFIFLLLFNFMIWYSLFRVPNKFVEDIENGVKVIETGVIVDKETKSIGVEDRDSYYYFHLSSKNSFKVDLQFYISFEIGQKISIHYAPLSKIIFNIEEIKNIPPKSRDTVIGVTTL